MALAHAVDEASHPSQTVCNLCVTGHSLGASAAATEFHWVAEFRVAAREPAPTAHVISYRGHSPSQRAPPASR